jgi:hypothetical protein
VYRFVLMARRLPLLALIAAVAPLACRPATIAEAEAKGDVAWLEQNGTPDAVAALGRLADKDPKAATTLRSRQFDAFAFRAAWAAVLREAAWGSTMLRAALADPKQADLAASGMGRREPHLVSFLADLDGALVRLSASKQNFNVSSALASVGPSARQTIERRLIDSSTRAAMCRGIASNDAETDAHNALLSVPEKARDDPACVDAVARVAAQDENALAWLGERGEPGLLSAAGKEDALPCAKLHAVWAKAFVARPATLYSALTVPLGHALKRCAAEMDGVLADAIVRLPATHGVVVEAIDPWANYGGALRATCAALVSVASGKDTAFVRERATDALFHACKAPG